MSENYGLEQIHKVNLEMLAEIDRICEKHQLTYSLDAGTLLGAVRHQGFIPWDDDADVIMPREDFDIFCRIAGQELPEQMELVTPEDLAERNAFYDANTRIIYRHSNRHRPDAESDFYGGTTNRAWIDIFVMDNLPDNAFRAGLHTKRLQVIYTLMMAYRYEIHYAQYPALLKVLAWTGSKFGKLFPLKTLLKKRERIIHKVNTEETKQIFVSNYAPDWYWYHLDKSILTPTQKTAFENTKLRIFAHYDEILTRLYGDYMQLPPEEKRFGTHETVAFEVTEEPAGTNL